MSDRPPPSRRTDRRPSKGRIEALSDAVFAVAITLLVLDLALEGKAEDGHLWSELGALGYQYVAHVISFLTIGKVTSVDLYLIYRNLLLLAVVTFFPFPTGILSEYLTGSGSANHKAAVTFYGLTLILLSAPFVWLWLRVYRHPENPVAWVDAADIRSDVRRSVASVIVVVFAANRSARAADRRTRLDPPDGNHFLAESLARFKVQACPRYQLTAAAARPSCSPSSARTPPSATPRPSPSSTSPRR